MAMWWSRRRDPRVGDEVRFHRDRLIEDYLAQGLDRAEAERRARLEFGDVTLIEDAVLDVRAVGYARWRRLWLDDLVSDLRYAARTLRRSPGFFVVAVLSFALGIGANAAIFTLINAVMLRTLPVAEPDRLVQISRFGADGYRYVVAYPLFELLRDKVTSLSGVFAQASADLAVTIDGEDEFVSADLVSGDYYRVLGIHSAAAGRLLDAGDDVPSPGAPAAVITDRFWLRRFGRNPGAIGKAITINDRVFTIVGVTSPSFQSAKQGRAPDLMLPLMPMMRGPQQRSPGFNWLALLGRLKPGVTLDQANAEIDVIDRAYVEMQAAAAPEKERAAMRRGTAAAEFAPDGFNTIRDTIARPLLILMGIVGLILVLACVNLSGLLLARAAAREREISIRLAIGASRGRLVRQFLTESLVLALIGGTIGFALAGWFTTRLFILFVGGSGAAAGVIASGVGGGGADVVLSTAADWRVVAFTCAISVLACIVAGLTPAWQAMRVQMNPLLTTLRAHGLAPSQGHGHGRGRLGQLLVIAQLAVSMVLLVGATLFLGTLVRLNAVDRGMESDGVLVMGVRTSRPSPIARAKAVQTALLEKLRGAPGVQSASAVRLLPLTGGLVDRGVRVEGYTFRPNESEQVGFNIIAPEYFATLRTPVIAGREFNARDGDTAPKVAVVNESFARYFFGGAEGAGDVAGSRRADEGRDGEVGQGAAAGRNGDAGRDGDAVARAVGRHVTSANVTYEIVGVVRDAKYQSLRKDAPKTVYVAWLQQQDELNLQPASFTYLARVTTGDPLVLRPGLDRLVREADPALRVRNATSYDALIDQSIATERILATLGGLFGGLAVIVAAVGVFGVLAFQVARRTNELGIRVALGATRATIVRHVLRDVIVMLTIAIVLGTTGAFALTGLARNILFGFTTTDPRAFLIAAAILTSAALLAGWLPARRAARVDPLVALRHE
jgi:predicted permease